LQVINILAKEPTGETPQFSEWIMDVPSDVSTFGTRGIYKIFLSNEDIQIYISQSGVGVNTITIDPLKTTFTRPVVAPSITSSLQGTASLAINAISASYVLNAISSSYASTASYLNTLNQDLTFNGNLTLNGTASIAYLNVTYESASVIYSSGSNQLGDATNDTQTLIGTIIVSGSQRITGSLNVSAGITGSLFGTSSWASNATTASYVLNAVSSSFAISASRAVTASYILNAVSSSFATSASRATTSSYAITASYAMNGGGGGTPGGTAGNIQYKSGSTFGRAP
jgi:hypothetical protein